MSNVPIPKDYALKIALILRIYAHMTASHARDFVYAQTREAIAEWTFQGGKFYNHGEKWRIAVPVEYETPERCTQVALVNSKLASLRRRYLEGRPAWLEGSDQYTAFSELPHEQDD